MSTEEEVLTLREEVRVLNRALTGMRNFVKIAAEYQNEDLSKRVDGIQAALAKAAEYEPRAIKRRNGR